MNTTTIFDQHSLHFQFLSVCHYLTSFGIFFYNKELIPLDQRNQSVAVLNTLFEYLNKSKNESETKLHLLQIVLQETDLYGGGENETLDMKYVNETYQYIISNALFSHYGNINGYLAEIINQADNVNYFALKQTVFQHLSKNYTSVNFCSEDFNSGNKSIKLTPLAVQKVFHDHIWPIFPEPEQDMSIIDVNYIYAMVGLKIVRSMSVDLDNFTFDFYIQIAREIDFDTDNETSETINLFSAPALFYRAHTAKEKFRHENITALSSQFWTETNHKFFLYLKSAMQEIINKSLENSLHYKFEMQLENLKTRTKLAYELLYFNCRFDVYNRDFQFYVWVYKSVYLFITKMILPGQCRTEDLPELDDVYKEQFDSVKKTYNEIERGSIEQILINSDLMRIMNSPNVVVKLARPGDYPQRCNWCSPTQQQPDENVYLMFAITKDSKTDFYALKQGNGSLMLLSKNADESNFYKELGIKRVLNIETAQFARILKRDHENADAFVQNVADMKTEKFLRNLMRYYKESTKLEEMMSFVKSFIPFYSCVESIRDGDVPGATWSCSLDVISLIPVGQFSAKYVTILQRSLITDLSEAAISNSIRGLHVARSIPSAIGIISRSVISTVVEETFTTRFMRDLTFATLRSVDPGFEITYQITRFNLRLLTRTYRKLRTSFGNPRALETLLEVVQRNLNTVTDRTGLVPRILVPRNGPEQVRYLYPGGRNFIGPRCLTPSANFPSIELRTLEDTPFEVPVVPVSSDPNDLITYRQYNPKTGKLSENQFRIGRHDMLRKLDNFVDVVLLDSPEPNVMNFGNNFRESYLANLGPAQTDDSVYVYPDFPVADAKNHYSLNLRNSKKEIIQDDVYVNLEPGPSKAKGNFDSNSKQKFEHPEELEPVLQNDYIAKMGMEEYKRYINLLKKFKNEGLSIMKNNWQSVRSLRLAVDNIGLIQSGEIGLKSPIDLWLIQVVNRPKVVNFLIKLKSEEFHFNDMTLVTSDVFNAIMKQKSRPISLETIVYYRMSIDTHYGLVDLNRFHENFLYEYIIYPDVTFTVTDVKYPDSKDYLILELKQNPLSEEQWKKIRHREMKTLLRVESQQSQRMQSIERAANFLVENVPLYKFIDSTKLLKHYLLKIEPSSSWIPTYDKLAQDIYRKLHVPEKYVKYRIKHHVDIDDVLFNKKLARVYDYSTALEKIEKLFQGLQPELVHEIFQFYSASTKIQDMIRFEDFYALNCYTRNPLLKGKHFTRRVFASSYRLSLKQCGENWIKNPITLYQFRMHSAESYLVHKSYRKRNILTFFSPKQFSSKREFEVQRLFNDPHSSTDRPILYEIHVKNQAGIANINKIIDNDSGMHIVTPSIQFVIDSVGFEIIEKQHVLVVRMHDSEIPQEERMIKMVEGLHELFSTNTLFYVKD